eukprot:745967-Rhodomonas_salina.1
MEGDESMERVTEGKTDRGRKDKGERGWDTRKTRHDRTNAYSDGGMLPGEEGIDYRTEETPARTPHPHALRSPSSSSSLPPSSLSRFLLTLPRHMFIPALWPRFHPPSTFSLHSNLPACLKTCALMSEQEKQLQPPNSSNSPFPSLSRCQWTPTPTAIFLPPSLSPCMHATY